MHRLARFRSVVSSTSVASSVIKKRRSPHLLMAAACAAGLGGTRTAAAATTVTWTDATSDMLWSDAGNFTGTPTGNDVVFGNAGAATSPGVVTNIVDQSFTINSLNYNNFFDVTNGATVFQTTQINAGVALNVTGTNGFRVGGLVSPAITSGYNTTVAITGAGALNVNNAAGSFIVSNESGLNAFTSTSTANLDLSGLGTFTANVNFFTVGGSTNNVAFAEGAIGSGNLILADTNVITSGTVAVALATTNARPSTIRLGRVNTINTDSLIIGRDKGGPATLSFNNTNNASTLVLRSRSGTGRAAITLGDFSGQSASAAVDGIDVLDLRGGNVDALVSTLNIAIGQVSAGTNTQGAGSSAAVVYFDTGTLDATTINIAKASGNNLTRSIATGTLNVSGGLVKAGSILMASQATSQATATLNLTGGTIQVTTGDIAVGGGIANVNIDGGVLDLGPAGRTGVGSLGSATSSISNFRLNSGSIQNVNNVYVKNALAFTGGSIANLSGTFLYDDAGQAGTIAGTIGGAGSFTKSNGAGTLTVTSTGKLNTTGITTVNAGTILVDGGAIASKVVINSGGTLSLSPNGGTVSGTSLTVNTGGVFDSSAAGGFSFTGARTLTGTGTLVGNFTTGGGAIVNPGGTGVAGTLTFNNALNLNANTTLNIDLSTDHTTGSSINDLLQVSGNLALSGTTAVAVNTLGAGLTPGSYTLIQYGGSLSGGTSSLVLTGSLLKTRATYTFDASTPNQINLIVSGGSPAGLVWRGDGTANRWNVAGDLNFLNGGSPDKFLNFDSVTFDDSAIANNHVNVADTVLPGVVTVNAAGDYFFQGTGKISGTGSLVQQGPGTLYVTNSGGNDYSGGTVINGGTLNVGNGGSTGDLGTGGITNNANLVLSRTGAYTLAGQLFGSGNATVTAGVVTLGGDNSNFTGNVQVAAGVTLRAGSDNALTGGVVVAANGATIDVNGKANRNVQLTVSGTGVGGAGAITNTGVSQTNALSNVTLAGDTTFGGTARWDIRGGGLSTGGNPYNLTINASTNGTVALVDDANVDGALADITITSGTLSYEGQTFGLGDTNHTIFVQPAGTLNLSSSIFPLGKPIALNGGTLSSGAGTSNNIVSNVAVNANSTINVATSSTLQISGAISGSNTLNKIGTATLNLEADNSAYTGLITINGGSINVDSNNALGSTNVGTVLALSTITGGGYSIGLRNNVVVQEPLTMNTSASPDFRATVTGGGTYNTTWAGPINIIGNGFATFTANGILNLTGAITGTAAGTILLRGASSGNLNASSVNFAGTVAHADAGAWTISGTNNHWLATQAYTGRILLGNDNAFPIDASILLGQAANVNTGTVDLSGFSQITTNVSIAVGSTGAATNQTLTNSSANLSTLTINAGTASTSANKFTGNLALVKNGTASVTLTSALNSYTGGTTINAGSLISGVANALPAGGSVTLGTSGTLDLNSFNLTIGQLAGPSTSAVRLGKGVFTVGADNSASIFAGNISDSGGLSASVGGTMVKAGTGNLILSRPAGLTLPNLTVSGGSVNFGGSNGAVGAFNVTGTLNVADGTTVVYAATPSTTVNPVIHAATTLNLNAAGLVDLNNNALVTQTSVDTVRGYLATAAAAAFIPGTNAAIYSSVVAADTAHKSIAYLSGANTNNAALSSALTNTAAVLIRPSLVGDFNIDGKVDRFDIRAFNARNAFNDGLTTHDWADGDLNFDGKVDRFDIRAFNAGNNFNSGAVFAQAQTLTSATPAAISSTTTVGTVGDGKPDLVYNSTTGDVIFKYDGYTPGAGFTVLELDIASSKNSLNANGVNAGAAGSISKGSNDIDYQNLGSTPIADGADLGTIFPTGLSAAQLTTNNITANFFLNGDGSPTKFADVVGGAGGVPEPATLSLIGIAAAGLLSRKRRK